MYVLQTRYLQNQVSLFSFMLLQSLNKVQCVFFCFVLFVYSRGQNMKYLNKTIDNNTFIAAFPLQGIMWPQVVTGILANLVNALLNYIFLFPLDLGVR